MARPVTTARIMAISAHLLVSNTGRQVRGDMSKKSASFVASTRISGTYQMYRKGQFDSPARLPCLRHSSLMDLGRIK